MTLPHGLTFEVRLILYYNYTILSIVCLQLFDIGEINLYRSLSSEHLHADCYGLATGINLLNRTYRILPYSGSNRDYISYSKCYADFAAKVKSTKLSM